MSKRLQLLGKRGSLANLAYLALGRGTPTGSLSAMIERLGPPAAPVRSSLVADPQKLGDANLRGGLLAQALFPKRDRARTTIHLLAIAMELQKQGYISANMIAGIALVFLAFMAGANWNGDELKETVENQAKSGWTST